MDKVIEKTGVNWKKWTIIGSSLSAFIIMSFLVFKSFNANSITVDKEKFRYGTVTEGEFSETVPFRAEVAPKRTIYLDTLEGGKVVIRHLEEGALVKAGEAIITMVNPQVQLDVIGREAQVTEQLNNLYSQELALEQSQLEIRRLLIESEYKLKELSFRLDSRRKLAKKNLVSEEELKLLEAEFDYRFNFYEMMQDRQKREDELRSKQIVQLEESLSHLNKNLEVARKNLKNLIIKAPIDGQLSQLNAEIGESINSGERLGQIDVVNEFKISAFIDEYYVTRVRVGQRAVYQLNNKTYELKLQKIYPSIQGGQFEVDLEFIGDYPNSITRGQTFQANLHLSEAVEVALLERGGFFQDTGGAWAFVLNKEQSAAYRTSISLGRRNNKFFEVVSGLRAGDVVLISSYGDLARRDTIQFN